MVKQLVFLFYSFCLSCFWLNTMLAQTNDTAIQVQSTSGVSRNNTFNSYKKALDSKDNYALAKHNEELANQFFNEKKYKKAEAYFKKAVEEYKKLSRNADEARVLRMLGKSQEAQSKSNEAIQSYSKAADAVVEDNSSINGLVNDVVNIEREQKLNMYDAERLRAEENPKAQQELIQQKIVILNATGSKDEAAENYTELGKIAIKNKDEKIADQNFKAAILNAREPATVEKVANEISDIYASEGKLDKAIEVQKSILNRGEIANNTAKKIQQTQKLATLYAQQQNADEAIKLLNETYALAIKENRTIDAKNSLQHIAQLYLKEGKNAKSIELYQDFLTNLNELLIKDNSLNDAKINAIVDEKLEQLEEEKQLQNKLYSRTKRFNIFLIIASIALLAMLLAIIRALYQINIKNKKIALQSLRREMNPHFVFNSLNSVNQFIAQNNEIEANKYLTSYSGLMRQTMENSNKDFVSISTELDMLNKYVNLEQMRFSDKFTYSVQLDSAIDIEQTYIPNMIIQPHVENAIWHGLRYKESKGNLIISIKKHDDKIEIKIEDNGIGITESKAMKTAHQRQYESRGVSNTAERISILNEIYKTQICCVTTEKQKPESGTIVTITFENKITV